MSESVLVANELAKAYKGRRVVKNVSLSVNAGEIVGLLGPNGAGKTSLLRILAGLYSPDESGDVFDYKILQCI